MVTTKVLERSDVPQEQRWNDTSVFENREAWQTEYEALNNELPKLGEFKDTLSNSPDTLADYWELEGALRRRLMKLRSYISMSTSVDSNGIKSNDVSTIWYFWCVQSSHSFRYP